MLIWLVRELTNVLNDSKGKQKDIKKNVIFEKKKFSEINTRLIFFVFTKCKSKKEFNSK